MAKRVFFCFHYEDVKSFRANVVRNHWVTKDDAEDAGFFDASLWESTRLRGATALKRLIHSGLENTSVTCVLIGSGTFDRPWVRYEILKSMARGNDLLGIHINGIPDKTGSTKDLGPNPFDYLAIQYSDDGKRLTMFEWTNGKWTPYSEVDDSSSYSVNASSTNWGKFFQLSKLYPTYLWNKQNGYENFGNWVGDN
jgi:hypothetical protein